MDSLPHQVIARILARCVPQGDCLVWTGGLDKDGYGKTTMDGRHWRAHRLVWTLTFGPIGEGLHLDHVKARGCTSRACLNVAHLEPVTPQVNWKRSDAPSRINGDSDTCPAGHDLTDPAVCRVNRSGTRRCRTCLNAWQREQWAAKTPQEREAFYDARRARSARRKATA